MTLRRQSNNYAIKRQTGRDAAKCFLKDVGQFIQQYTPILENQQSVTHQIIEKE